jgi:hypothetical protein
MSGICAFIRIGGVAVLALQLAVTGAAAQLRGLGGSVPSVGGAVPSIGGGVSTPSGTGAIGPGPPPLSTTREAMPGGGTVTGGVGGAGGQLSLPSDATRREIIDTVTNSLAGSVINATSRAASAVARTGNSLRQPNGSVRSGVPPVGERRYMPNEVVVALPDNRSARAIDDLARRYRLTLIESQRIALLGTTYHRWRVADGRSVTEVIRALEADGAVQAAQPNYRFTLQQSPPPAGGAAAPAGIQYAVNALHLSEAHRVASGAGVLVAVIDSGIDASHAEIVGAIADQYDAVAPTGPPHRHGTGIAGVIVAHSRITGVAPEASILAIRAFGGAEESAEATTLSIVRGIDWAIARGARIINMSFAGPHDPGIEQGLSAARQRGAVLVAAAGNAGPKSPPLYPAADKNVIAVTATDAQNQLLPAANRGPHIALAAPGVDILVPAPGQTYALSTGTSVAAAHVSGLVALLLELRPELTPDRVRQILLSTCLDLGPKGRDDLFGHGLVDAQRAVQSLGPSAAPPKPAALFGERWPTTLRPSHD